MPRSTGQMLRVIAMVPLAPLAELSALERLSHTQYARCLAVSNATASVCTIKTVRNGRPFDDAGEDPPSVKGTVNAALSEQAGNRRCECACVDASDVPQRVSHRPVTHWRSAERI